MKKYLVSIYDAGDKQTYDLSMTEDDMLAIFNMKTLKKNKVELPSIGGNAVLNGNDVMIVYSSDLARTNQGTIGVSFYDLLECLEDAHPRLFS
ncbi:hypothetical protein [Aquitalea aquatica]|uniref:Uncharacterized protein n=1 Tax=Aquitalea aquatica TaxID=3044273 RepID=A0A838YFP2_9NEIS|nr:hypothetical protein [Aquitalea magnusonii]MBA4709564.1 hypothetical protein [Aquitalea magnusonii]